VKAENAEALSPGALWDGSHAIADSDIAYSSAVPFLLVHLGCVAAIWTGVTWQALALCISLYWLRMFAVTAGYHCYLYSDTLVDIHSPSRPARLETRVSRAPAGRPDRFSISPWPMKQSFASHARAFLWSIASGPVVLACVSFERFSPRKSARPFGHHRRRARRPCAAGSPPSMLRLRSA